MVKFQELPNHKDQLATNIKYHFHWVRRRVLNQTKIDGPWIIHDTVFAWVLVQKRSTPITQTSWLLVQGAFSIHHDLLFFSLDNTSVVLIRITLPLAKASKGMTNEVFFL